MKCSIPLNFICTALYSIKRFKGLHGHENIIGNKDTYKLKQQNKQPIRNN